MAGTVRGVLASTVAASPLWSPRARARLLGFLGVRLTGGARVYPWIRFAGGVSHLEIGRGSFVNMSLTVGANADVVLGERVYLGPGVSLLPSSHELGPRTQRAGATVSAPIRIGDGAWLGAGVTVLGGVTIGAGCVIAAGAVVARDTEPDTLHGGVPARFIRRLEPADPAVSNPSPGSTDRDQIHFPVTNSIRPHGEG
ncbi:acyltransferase [Geodermatophilus sp. DF01-2]|uniref:acyltransferase n=1 Tax=Geodermatophilus sp. DF01-2 TaxID=2559610 RepID=UPI001073EB43|nr:DapH/DapD/GlmU-related protein [Geodermatophilus sp. DF01_2]TFV64679.1 acyltransferase [Geodermatophilus sp. DF01_2]